MIKPRALRSKDRIAIIAPGSRPARPSMVKRAQALISEMGYTPVIGDYVLNTHGYMAGTDEERLKDLRNALDNDGIAAVWFLTGGFGVLPLLDKVPYGIFREHPKIVIGGDDNSHLLLALNKLSSVITYHGANLDRIESREAFEQYKKFFSGHEVGHFAVKDKVVPGFCYSPVRAKCKGPLLPANLTALVSLFGTRFQPELTGSILMLEDRSERNDILDRWFTTLYISGKLASASALGLGQFEKCDSRNAFNMLSFEELVSDRVQEMELPTCFDLPFGQSGEGAIVPVGLNAVIDTASGAVEMLEPLLDKA